ncbi:MAG: hypothetical protein JST44_20565 [Cyanobacteria bacterium SZAS LIN-5]|nr:hypothetical protein [Cyanobacteria bacterium SZAS LIN-5]
MSTASQKLKAELNGISADLGIPPLLSLNISASRYGSTIRNDLYVGLGNPPKVDPITAEHIYHEFNHHTQGPMHGIETIAYYAKTPVYSVLKRVGLIDEIPLMQATRTRNEYMAKYIGSTSEREAWATGLLVRLRAIAAGIPNVQD